MAPSGVPVTVGIEPVGCCAKALEVEGITDDPKKKITRMLKIKMVCKIVFGITAPNVYFKDYNLNQ